MLNLRRAISRELRGAFLLATALEITTSTRTYAAPAPGTLPIVCVAGNCGGVSFVSSGSASATSVANTLTVNQTSDRAILNWASFDVAADGRVIFSQPSASSIALNRIFQASPSQIFGLVKANGQIYLINQNGFVFGSNARVNVGGLLTSSLNIATDSFNAGLLSAITDSKPALAGDGTSGSIVVQAGAQLTTNAAGQRILLAAPNIENGGAVSAPDGQVVLAAGEQVFLQASTDPKLRGLLVEVNAGGKVTNQISGELSADRGNVTLVGLAVNQEGRVSATTSIKENGSIRLLARDTVTLQNEGGVLTPKAQVGGRVELGAQSVTTVIPDATDKSTAVDEQAQLPSTIEMNARQIIFAGGSKVISPGGQLTVKATADSSAAAAPPDREARIRIDSGAVIDLSGSVATVPVNRSLVTVELRANELADSPAQRDGVLRGKTVVIDSRVGTLLANVDGAIALTQRDIYERTSTGGTAVFDSTGDVIVGSGARVDVSGGGVQFTPGTMQTSQLIKSDGSIVDIGKASPDDTYIGVVNPMYRAVSDKWGVIRIIPSAGISQYDPGYFQGQSAGSIQFLGSSLALNGELTGTATNGAYQRTLSTMAHGGNLVIGSPSAADTSLPDFRAPAVEFVESQVPLVVSDDTSLPLGLPLNIQADLIKSGGFSRVQIASNERITLPEDVPLQLAPGVSLELTAPHIGVYTSVAAPAGSILLTSLGVDPAMSHESQPGIFIGDDVNFRVSGLWTNDTLISPSEQPKDTVGTKGGNIGLDQRVVAGQLSLGSGVNLVADGGAWLSRNGTASYGAGGSININAGPQGSIDVGDNIHIEAYGVQSALGGSLALTAPRIAVSSGDSMWLRAQSVDPDSSSTGSLRIDTSVFSDFGFSSIALTANGPRSLNTSTTDAVIDVAPGSVIDLRSRSLLLQTDAIKSASQTPIETLATVVQLPEYLRNPTKLSLNAVPVNVTTEEVGTVNVGVGARFVADRTSSLSITSVGSIQFDGEVTISSGSVTMNIVKPQASYDAGFSPGLHIELGEHAVIDVSGAVRYVSDDGGTLHGTQVLAGGAVSLAALRGSVITDEHSLIDFSGAQGSVDVASSGVPVSTPVASAGGSLTVQAPESISLLGSFYGEAGTATITGANAAAGSLTINLTRVPSAFEQLPGGIEPFPTGARTIVVRSFGSNFDETQRVQLPNSGLAEIDLAKVIASGVDWLSLSSDDRIQFASGIDMSLARGLVLQAPALAVSSAVAGNADAPARLTAPYISLGSGIGSYVPELPTVGGNSLVVEAGSIDFVGALALQDIALATFSAARDVQLRGTVALGDSLGKGSISSAGDLTFSAARVVVSTGVDFIMDATAASTQTVRFQQNGVAAGTPLSAAGALTVNAANIQQGGTILVPFGSIALNASNELSLLAGSTTSVSGNAALIPYGRVDNGIAWVYEPIALRSSPVTAVPGRSIALSGGSVVIADGARVDVSGGGDLYAYQWTPGTGGTTDSLAPLESAGMYAILPSSQAQSVPYDPMLWSQTGLDHKQQSVYLSGTPGVPVGTYALLPARYALLPGAYLISQAAGFQDLQPGVSANVADGATVTAGYFTYGDTHIGDTRFSGFVVRPGSYAHLLATYDDHLASQFFAADARDTIIGPSTADAGVLTVIAQHSFQLLGSVGTKGASGGENATVEIAVPDLEIVPDAVIVSENDRAAVSASLLKSWNPGRLLLGAHATSSGDIAVLSDSIHVLPGSTLVFDELLLAAKEKIEIDANSVLGSRSLTNASQPIDAARLAQATQLSFDSASKGAAVIALSDMRYLVPTRDPSSTTGVGTVEIASGASVGSRATITIDAPGGAALAEGTLSGAGARWSLGANHIVYGVSSTGQTGDLTIDQPLVDALNTATSVRLASSTSLDLTRSLNLGRPLLQELDVYASAINNVAPGITANLTAKVIKLGGVETSPPISVGGSGILNLVANTIDVGPGTLGLYGFDSTTLSAAGGIIGHGAGGVTTAGDLILRASHITTESGADTSFDSAATLAFVTAGTAVSGSELQTGGSLTASAKDINGSARILMPSGTVTLISQDTLMLDSESVIDVGGQERVGAAHGSTGGVISLTALNDINVAGAHLSVAGGSKADAGRLDITSTRNASVAATLNGQADAGFQGGTLHLTAGSITDFTSLNQHLESGGFTYERDVRVTTGDLEVASQSTITARHVELTADAGMLTVAGTINAAGFGDRSTIKLNAGSNLDVTGKLVADTSDSTTAAGVIELATSEGMIDVASAAVLSATGGAGQSRLTLRAPRVGSDINITHLDADLSGIDSVIVQPVVTSTLSSEPDSAEFSAIRTDVLAYTAAASSNIKSRLGAQLIVQPYIDMQSEGDLTVSDLDLSTWRFGGQAAVIALRASGNLTVQGTIGDGFRTVSTGFNSSYQDLSGGSSSTITLVAGADFLGASNTSVNRQSQADLALTAGSLVRTGSGDLTLISARDIAFEDGARAYTGGIAGQVTKALGRNNAMTFATGGGNVAITANRDILGASISQSVGDWQPVRVSTTASWGVDFGAFGWNLGALGGGDLVVSAGRDISNLSAAVADSQSTTAGGAVNHYGGGNLRITADRDVNTGLFYLGQGSGHILAGGALGSARIDGQGNGVGTLLMAANASYSVVAQRDVQLLGEFSATALWPGDQSSEFFFFRYGPDSKLRVVTNGGSIVLNRDGEQINELLGPTVASQTDPGTFNILPASVDIASYASDVLLSESVMTPAQNGQLTIYAARDISSLGSSILMSDADPSVVPSFLTPTDNSSPTFADVISAALVHTGDLSPALLRAGRDIRDLKLSVSKAAQVTAGRDVVNFYLQGQNLNPTDITSVNAGRDIAYTTSAVNATMDIVGPGGLEVLAGRDIDFGFAAGISSYGNLRNAKLPDVGADVSVVAGLGAPLGVGTGVDVGSPRDFISDVVLGSSNYEQLLIDYVSKTQGNNSLQLDAAVAAFRSLDRSQQLPLLSRVLFQELVRSGREANTDPKLGFERGFSAIDALFPGSRNADSTTPSPYVGNVTLGFSRIYTLDGGSIALLVPGGVVNVGLANPPPDLSLLGLSRTPSQLGLVAAKEGDVSIFANGDVLVNTSRVFTLGGGNIAIWSSEGNIDAGRGAKSAISAPPPTIVVDSTGGVKVDFSAAVAGSGIRTIITGDDVAAGDVDLIAPAGFVNAGDAGIGSSGNLNIAAQHVVGVDNIQVGGVSTGVPPETSGLGITLAAASSAASSSSGAANASVSDQPQPKDSPAPIAQSALSWLDVFVVGLGEDNCKQDDMECLKRQKAE